MRNQPRRRLTSLANGLVAVVPDGILLQGGFSAMPKIRVKVDPDLCIGAASCVTIAPETFQMNEENKAYVLDHGTEPTSRTYEREMEVTESEYQMILLGAQSCPTLAIFIYDEQGNQLFPEL